MVDETGTTEVQADCSDCTGAKADKYHGTYNAGCIDCCARFVFIVGQCSMRHQDMAMHTVTRRFSSPPREKIKLAVEKLALTEFEATGVDPRQREATKVAKMPVAKREAYLEMIRTDFGVSVAADFKVLVYKIAATLPPPLLDRADGDDSSPPSSLARLAQKMALADEMASESLFAPAA